MRGKRSSDEFAKAIYTQIDSGKSIRETANNLGVHPTTIARIVSRRISDTNSQQKAALGRPKITSTRTDHQIILALKRKRFAPFIRISKQFHVSRQTVSRRARLFSIKKRRALVNVLSRMQQLNRLRWCKLHKNSNFTQWIFSDEATFQLADCSSPRRPFVARKPGEKYAPACVVFNPVKSRESLTIWGCIRNDGSSRFHILRGTVNADRYITILQQNLIPLLDNVPLSQLGIIKFQQDNAPPHVAGTTTQFLQENGVSTVNWPAYSPDLNPIENIWGLLKRFVRRQGPQNLDQLDNSIRIGWNRIVRPKLCRRLFASMPARINRVQATRGLRF